ncbi:hypothetical protein [Dyadobacter frigoris]|uniref:Uncharacterized protein n=1 Tax=Dyadobacter frigoris TaxID=2576211 RepID=A0A4U6CTL4_9BACT|nr:hypothetical protein [Dyadobacter frigoris]TKT86927.1 hypothetical protein FDK13_31260 [Dyadobacter frigoris]GLU56568.1 hypothetical protein Dfri01_60290 [Dyadobacter frigoris]
MKKVILSVILGFAFFSCNQNDPEDLVKTPEKITFSGILLRDERGLPLSEVDPDDWNIKDTWVEQEISLFGSNLKTNCPATDYEIIAYPNPVKDKAAIHVYKPDSVRLAIRIVDKNFKTLFAKDSLYTKINMIDFSAFGITDTVRVYYKFINGGCEFRGHGDVVIGK